MAWRKLTRREITLLVGLGLVAVVMLYFYRGDSGSRVAGREVENDDDEGPGKAPVVQLAKLHREAEPYDARGRDLFKYSQRPVAPWERDAQRAAAEARRIQEQKARENRPKPPPRPAQQPPPRPDPLPKPDFTYLGYLGPKDNKIAVFEKGVRQEDEDPLLLARAGEVLEERFLLKEINFQSVVIGYTEDRWKGKTTELSMKKGASRSGGGGSGRRGRRR